MLRSRYTRAPIYDINLSWSRKKDHSITGINVDFVKERSDNRSIDLYLSAKSFVLIIFAGVVLSNAWVIAIVNLLFIM